MKKSFLLIFVLSLSAITLSCSDETDEKNNKSATAFVSKRTPDMVDFEASFAINAKRLQNGEITQAELEEITVATSKKYLLDNNEIIKPQSTDVEIVTQALNLNLLKNQKLSSKH